MKSGFKDRTEIKHQNPKDNPASGGTYPVSFECPRYDERTSGFVQSGTNYGVGVAQPIGTENITDSYAIPLGRVHTMKVVINH